MILLKRIALLIFLFLLYSHGFLFGQPPQKLLKKEDLEKDLDAYRDSIKAKHIAPFTKRSEKDFSKEIDRIKKESSSMNEDELLVEFFKLNAKIQDEHTGIAYRDKQFFPLTLYSFEEGFYIVTADSEYKDVVSSKIIEVNNTKIDDVLKKIAELIPGNQSQIGKTVAEYFSSPVILHGLKITDNLNFCTLTVVRQKGDTVKVKVHPKNLEQVQLVKIPHGENLLRNQSRENYWYKYDSLTSSLYFQYRRCVEDKQKPFSEFQKELFRTLDSTKAQRLIIDMRYNGGGSSSLLKSFVDELWKTDVRKNRKLYVIIGRRTFSSAVLNAFDLKMKDYAILLGEETGGNANHFGEVKEFTLPNTRLRVGYSTKYFERDKDQDGGLKPDKLFPVKFSDFSNEVDPALDYSQTH